MRIEKILKKMRKGDKISSEKANMASQTRKTILYWLFEADTDLDRRIKQLKEIHDADDWEFDED